MDEKLEIEPSPAFREELGRLCDRWGPPGKKGDFMMDITRALVSAIQAGRAAAQGAGGIVICGRCGQVVHTCKD